MAFNDVPATSACPVTPTALVPIRLMAGGASPGPCDGPRGRAVGPAALVAWLPAVALVGALTAPPQARAQEVLETDAKIVVHLVPATGTIGCNSSKGRVACDKMKAEGDLNQPYYAFICVIDADASVGVAGVQFGVEYNRSNNRGVDIFDWNNCGTLQFPTGGSNWYKNAGGGNQITWDVSRGCPREEPGGAGTGVVAVAGYFYLSAYSDDQLKITKRPVDNMAKIADCAASEYVVEGFGISYPRSHLGYATFSSGAQTTGYNPCGDNQFRKTTWTGVKTSDNGGR